MVSHIRFLKPPKLTTADPPTFDLLITITTDLGDSFHTGPLPLTASLHTATSPPRLISVVPVTWPARARTLSISLRPSAPLPSGMPCRTHVRAVGGNDGDDSSHPHPQPLRAKCMPAVLDVWSAPFLPDGAGAAAPRVAERWLDLGGGRSMGTGSALRVREETGESIARHVWDAGLALAAYLREIVHGKGSCASGSSLGALLRRQDASSGGPHVLELGAGCGIAGLAVAHLVPSAQVLLTDLPEAMDVLAANIALASPAPGATLERCVLEWGAEMLPDAAATRRAFDLVLVADCTYNADSLPALVRTLSGLLARSDAPVVLVGMKVRHASERAFFGLMEEAGLRIAWRDEVVLPRGANVPADERIEIYEFGLRSGLGRPLG